MLKSILMSVWLMGLLAGSAYYFGSQSAETEATEKAASVLSAKYIKLDPITVALIRAGEVKGYVILEVAIAVDDHAESESKVPLQYLLRDLVLGNVHSDPQLDFYRLEQYDIGALGKKLTSDINEKLGKELVQDVLVQDINFISKQDVRDMLMRRS